MKKKLLVLGLAGIMAVAGFTGCGGSKGGDKGEDGKKAVALTVWGAEEDQELLQGMIDNFKKFYSNEKKLIDIRSKEPLINCIKKILKKDMNEKN